MESESEKVVGWKCEVAVSEHCRRGRVEIGIEKVVGWKMTAANRRLFDVRCGDWDREGRGLEVVRPRRATAAPSVEIGIEKVVGWKRALLRLVEIRIEKVVGWNTCGFASSTTSLVESEIEKVVGWKTLKASRSRSGRAA